MDRSDWKSSARGDAAWKETTDAIASRNAKVSGSGRVERETYEREREASRAAAAAKVHARLLGKGSH